MRTQPFPKDAIEAVAARIKYGLDGATYAKLTSGLPSWRLGRATFNSHNALRRIIQETAQFEPPSTPNAELKGSAA